MDCLDALCMQYPALLPKKQQVVPLEVPSPPPSLGHRLLDLLGRS